MTVGKTETLIKEIDATVFWQIEMARSKFNTDTERRQKADVFRADDRNRGFRSLSECPPNVFSFASRFPSRLDR